VIVNNHHKELTKDKLHITGVSNELIFINNFRNTGFAKACNDGAKRAQELFDPQYFVFLNDDVLFTDDWLDKCQKAMVENKWIATTPVLVDMKGHIENCGYAVLPYGKVRLIKKVDSKEKIDGITAAALVFEAKKFFELGGFDERFFAYLEDVDLFLRVKKLGLGFGVTKTVSVHHAGQKTSSQMKVKKTWLDFRNWILLIRKNWSREELVKNFPAIFVERLRNLFGIVKALF
jgi:GT2 family glycosyltransferase